MRRAVLVVAVLLVAMAAGAAAAQGTMEDFLAGKVAPFTLKLSDLDGSYLRFNSPYLAGAGWLSGMSRYGGESGPAYTQGKTVSIGGETYLIAYAADVKGGDPSIFMYGRPSPNAPEPEPVTKDTTLSLVLLGQRGMMSLGKARPFNLATELTDYQRYLVSYQEMVASRNAMERGPSAVAEAPSDNLKNVAMALDMFTGDHAGVLPPMDKPEALAKALDDYLENADVLKDPETKEPYGVNASLSGKKLADIKNPAKTIAVYQTKPGKDGARGVVLLDWSVKRLNEAEWTQLKAASKIP